MRFQRPYLLADVSLYCGFACAELSVFKGVVWYRYFHFIERKEHSAGQTKLYVDPRHKGPVFLAKSLLFPAATAAVAFTFMSLMLLWFGRHTAAVFSRSLPLA